MQWSLQWMFFNLQQISDSQNKYKPEGRREKEGKMGEKEGERKEASKQAKKIPQAPKH